MQSRDRIKYLFVAPGIIWILFFTIFPLISSLGLSFFKARLGKPLEWLGLKNYGRAFTDYRFTNFIKAPLNFGRWGSLEITIAFVIISVTLTVLAGLGLAMLFNRPIRGQRIFRSLFVLPLFTAPIALGYLGLTIFHEDLGPVNNFLLMLGLSKVQWISGVWPARMAIILVDVWQWTPFCFLVILAGLQALPEEIYEAARLDTSSAWDTFRYITLPLISPVLFTVTMLRMVEAFKVLDIPFSLTQGGPGKATQTLSFYVYLTGLRDWNRGYASAQAYILLFLVMIVSMFFFARMRQIYED